MVNWVADKELEEEEKHPRLEVHCSRLNQPLNSASATATLQRLAGGTLKNLEAIGINKWKTIWNEKEAAEKLMAVNGRVLEGGLGEIKVQQLETRLSFQEVIDLITERLDTNQRKSWKIPQREPRKTHAIVFEDDPPTTEIDMVRKMDSGKTNREKEWNRSRSEVTPEKRVSDGSRSPSQDSRTRVEGPRCREFAGRILTSNIPGPSGRKFNECHSRDETPG